MSAYSILPFLTSLTCLFFGILVCIKSPNNKIKLPFFLWCLFLSIWLMGYAIVYSTNDASQALFLTRIACAVVILFPVFFHHFVNNLLSLKNEKRLLYISYFVGLCLVYFSVTTNYFIYDVQKYFFGFYGKAGTLYFLALIFFSICLTRPVWLLYRHLKTAKLDPLEYARIKYILIGFAIAYLASVDFLPKFGIAIYPFGAIFILIWVSIVSFAILKYQILDINIALRKSLIYTILIAAITLFYLIAVLLVERFFKDVLGYQSFLISLFSATLIAAFFIPLRNKIQSAVDQIFFKGTPAEIAQENEYLRKEVAQAEKMKAVATLASGMAHEIRNPLTVIQTFFDQLPAKKDNPEFMRQLNTLVGKEVNRINDLVTQLLEFSKPSPLSLQETGIRRLIEDCLNLLGGQFSKHNIQVVKNFGAGDHTLKADANKLKQVFLNLFLNAIDAMPDGGTLTVSTRQSPSEPQATSHEPLLITVSDTGCGIAPHDLKHIFEPFYTTKQKGTGLGLAVCKNIIEEHGGTISAESVVGQGTVFKLEFPVRRDTHAS